MAEVELIGVRKAFGAYEAVRGVDLVCADGEFVVVVGPSGCGKSTLLRLVCGLETVSAGEIRIGGRQVEGVAPAKRGIAMVFQSYALYPHMTVAENMGFALRMAGVGRAERDVRVRKAAAALRLEPLLGRLPRELSGGQRQRVAIGRAIVREPKVFLFDEPLSNLDAELRVQMRLEIARLHRELGATMLYVTHDQVEAMTLADKIVVMRDGLVEQIGRPLDLYDDPANRFVAGFIGSPRMNFLDAVVAGESAAGVLLAVAGQDGAAVAVPLARDRPPIGTPVAVGIRPEHLVPVAAGTPGSLSFVAEAAEPLGSTTIAYLGGAAEPVVVEVRGRLALAVGEPVHVRADEGRVLAFAADGERLR